MYLGIDVGSQSIKAVLLSPDLTAVASFDVQYAATYPKYKTTDGFHIDGPRVTSPTAMWIEALDDVIAGISKLAPLSGVTAVSVSGQQHGSVYLAVGAETILQNLRADNGTLLSQSLPCLLLPYSPVWRDNSTQREVDALAASFGGDNAAFVRTGSRVTLRFTGPQMMKVRAEVPGFDKICGRVCLVSSFVTSLLLGGIAPIDVSDGSGMNVLNLNTREWDPAAEAAGVPTGKLGGNAVSSTALLGTSSPYWQRYGMRCAVIAGSGDNNNALVGTRIQPEDIAMSLGTSDTVVQTISKVLPPTFLGHIFAHPLYQKKFMSLLCVTNGSLARREVCEKACGGDWGAFSTALGSTPPGNDGYMGVYYLTPETVPHGTHGVWRGRFAGGRATAIDGSFPTPAQEVRAIVESQVLSLRLHSQLERTPARIVVTGGGSASGAICKVIADVFGCGVYVGKDTGGNAAAFGAAIRARIGAEGVGEDDVRGLFTTYPSEDVLVAQSDAAVHAKYTTMMKDLSVAIAAVRAGNGVRSGL